RNYTNNVSAMKKNLEKLSSGYKINRAGDDAAGLAISEKMRAQITGLETAQKNAKDGISLVQTAEGALTEVHDMLNRMVELATQSANGTYDNTTDRAQMQKELDQLRSEINRIADSSNFNGIKLLNGEMSSSGGNATPTDMTVTAVADGLRGNGQTAAKGVYKVDMSDLKIDVAAGAIAANTTLATVTVAGVTLGTIELAAARTASDAAATLTTGDFTFVALDGTATSATIGGLDFDVTQAGGVFTLTGTGKAGADPTAADVETFNGTDLSVGLAFGASATGNNNGYDFAVHATTPVAAASKEKLAQGEFKLNDADIKDGASITIGGNVYTFKVGANGSGSGGTVIDLSKFEEGSAGIAAEAAKVLSQQNDDKFHIQTIGTDGTVRLTEKAGALNDYKTWDLQGTTGSETDATWKNLKTGAGVVQFTKAAGGGKSLTLQIGDTADSFNQLKVDIQDMHCSSLGIASISIADQTSAQAAVDKIKAAINKVSDVRGTLGATQNRLDHTINNLSVMTENIQDAESTIRDTDVAEEMMSYTKNNILIQSAQAMLAQANQVPQGVLQLLQ
ncbi:flagellin, partial [Pseudoflavonifractor sp. 524-17]|uniref:flagellin N-terminal helical domain-containing protein n=1 Tax=Pseudoflavonifractor sp. 524-17 TaxID=2304577 RepID=UPI00192A46DD